MFQFVGFLVFLLGAAITACGIGGGVIYYCWVLSIVDIIQQFKAQTFNEWAIAYDVVRVLFLSPIIGCLSWVVGLFLCGVGIGGMTYKSSSY